MGRALARAGAIARLVIALWSGSLAFPASAESDDAALEGLRALDRRVAIVAYRLTVAAIPLCSDPIARAGMTIHALAQYDPAMRAAAARTFGLGDGPAVLALVPGGPAARAGIREDDRLIAIDGTRFATDPDRPKAGRFDSVGAAQRLLDTALAKGPATLEIERGDGRHRLLVTPELACPSLIQLVPGGEVNALADGRTVTIWGGLAEYAHTDDELAVVIGHELAHNLLHHKVKLDERHVSFGLLRVLPGNAARIRATEREADYVGLYLTARAGYDITAAPPFWIRFGKDHGLGILGDGTHPGERSRAAALQAEVGEIARKRAAGLPLTPGPYPASPAG